MKFPNLFSLHYWQRSYLLVERVFWKVRKRGRGPRFFLLIILANLPDWSISTEWFNVTMNILAHHVVGHSGIATAHIYKRSQNTDPHHNCITAELYSWQTWDRFVHRKPAVSLEENTKSINLFSLQNRHCAIVDVWLNCCVVENAFSKWIAIVSTVRRGDAASVNFYLARLGACKSIGAASYAQLTRL
jgi:hypothetical protein